MVQYCRRMSHFVSFGIFIILFAGCGKDDAQQGAATQPTRSLHSEGVEVVDGSNPEPSTVSGGGVGAESNAGQSQTGTPHKSMTLLLDAVPDFKFSVSECRKEFGLGGEADRAKLRRYDDKTIEVQGIVSAVQFTLMGEPAVFLASEDGSDPLPVITWNPKPWTEVLPGQNVKMRFQFYLPPNSDPIQIVDGVVAEISGETTMPSFSAADFMKAYIADPTVADRNWIDRQILIEGKCREREQGTDTFLLDADAAFPIQCVGFSDDDAGRIKPGETVRLIGTYTESRANDQQPRLMYSLLVSPAAEPPEPFTLNLKAEMDGETAVFTADSFVTLYRSNPRDFIRKFGKCPLRIAGTVNNVDRSFPHAVTISLLNSKGQTLTCGFSEADVKPGQAEIGSEVTVEGELFGVIGFGRDEKMSLVPCKFVGK